MAVTELARLRLQDGTEASSPSLHANLAKAKDVMEKASGFEFWYYHCLEEPNIIFILGSWPSVDFHMHQFIPGPQNQELLALLQDQITVEWMFHLDIDQRIQSLPLKHDVLSIDRYIVQAGKKERFQATFENNKHALESHVGEQGRLIWGWRLDKGYDPSIGGEKPKEQFVLLSGWDSIEQHLEFANTEVFQKYSQIRSHMEEEPDIKHARLMRVEELRR
ncbi:uncharacterized protein Z520_04038 [Fonsecaea multimorphosa CBS 102226]|uniref:ABM domain-containing protein n=1 Tax=Fonsecaea multimorphosa CBS 102226 TaxID=1442371 RepID=A0A0D2K3H5_9EURO|nr:uncharacterized protein Z520_04038 [Fonsecaea multimorphosa CBS 102226]KIY00353.1 hypothetical protein Z520_04038 [Fonsecaea multimorphosa CBS 102226]OAL27185.1 hypothetical protein AYO22_03816 [Fonsecaea multimorphosa]